MELCCGVDAQDLDLRNGSCREGDYTAASMPLRGQNYLACGNGCVLGDDTVVSHFKYILVQTRLRKQNLKISNTGTVLCDS